MDGKRVRISNLKVFGHTSYVHVDADQGNKLNAKSKNTLPLGMVLMILDTNFRMMKTKKSLEIEI